MSGAMVLQPGGCLFKVAVGTKLELADHEHGEEEEVGSLGFIVPSLTSKKEGKAENALEHEPERQERERP